MEGKVKIQVPENHASKGIYYDIIKNDGESEPKDLIRLLSVKELFKLALPKMPAPYISRLVFDFHHYSFCIYRKRTEEERAAAIHGGADPDVLDAVEQLVGAICFRPFPEKKFIEIAFCAVRGDQRSFGIGRLMMNLLKEHLKQVGDVDPNFKITTFLTYADNFAVGYFQKQGFYKRLTIDNERHEGRIKHYDEAILMQCDLYPHVNYLELDQTLKKRRVDLLRRVGIELIKHEHPTAEDRAAVVAQLRSCNPRMVPADDPARREKLGRDVLAILTELTTGENANKFVDLIESPDSHRGLRKTPGLHDPVWLKLMIERAQAGHYRTIAMVEAECTRFKDYIAFFKDWLKRCGAESGYGELIIRQKSDHADQLATLLAEKVRAMDSAADLRAE